MVNQIYLPKDSSICRSVLSANYGVVTYRRCRIYEVRRVNSNPYGIIKVNKVDSGHSHQRLYAIYHPRDNVYANFIQVYFEQHERMT